MPGSTAFTLYLPGDPTFRAIACDVAKRHLELLGGTDAERDALALALSGAIQSVATSTDADVECTWDVNASGLEVTVRCGANTTVVRQPLPAGAS